MSASWSKGSIWDRLALRWQGGAGRAESPIDIFAELKAARKILVAPSDRIGGIFLGAPACKLIRRAYPAAHIQLLVGPDKAALARQFPFVDEVLSVDFDRPLWSSAHRAARAALRRQAFDLAFCLGPDCSLRLAQLCSSCGARLRVGFRREGLELFNVEVVGTEAERHESERYLALLGLLGLEGESELAWALAPAEAEQLRHRVLGEGGTQVVGVNMDRGEGRGLSRRQCEDIVGRIVERGLRALLFFSLAERKQVNYLKEVYGNRAILFERGDFTAAAALLQSCKAFISCHADLLHMAVSLRVPVVGIFEESPQRWIAAGDSRVRVVRQADLRALSIAQIAEALDELLRASREIHVSPQ